MQSPRFAAISLSALDGKPLREARRILITAAARQENTGQQWNVGRTSVSDQWGHAPVLIEPVRAEITLERVHPAKGRLTVLASDGSSLKEIPVEPAEGAVRFTLPGDPATLWHVLHVQ